MIFDFDKSLHEAWVAQANLHCFVSCNTTNSVNGQRVDSALNQKGNEQFQMEHFSGHQCLPKKHAFAKSIVCLNLKGKQLGFPSNRIQNQIRI